MAFINFISAGGGGNPEAEAQLSARTAELTGVIDRTISGLTIPSGVTQIGEHAFDSCSALTEVTIHSGVTDIAANAFADNVSLATITFEGDTPPTVDADAFSNLPMDVEIVVPSAATGDYSAITEQVEESVIPWVTATDPNGSAYTYTYESGAVPENQFINWASCKVEMSNNITAIGNRAFANMQILSSLTLSTGITTIGEYAFQHAGGVTGTLSLPNIVTISEGAFQNMSGITAVELGENLTSIGDWTFIGCSSLSSITFHIPSPISIPVEALSGISSACTWQVPTDDPDFNYFGWQDTINYFNNYYSVDWELCDLSGNPITKYAQFEDWQQMRDMFPWCIDYDNAPTENLSVMFDDEAVLIIQNGNELFMPSIGTGIRIDREGIVINTTTDEEDDGTLTDQYNAYISWDVEDEQYLRLDCFSYHGLAEDYQYEDAGWTSDPQSDDITGWLYDTTVV